MGALPMVPQVYHQHLGYKPPICAGFKSSLSSSQSLGNESARGGASCSGTLCLISDEVSATRSVCHKSLGVDAPVEGVHSAASNTSEQESR